MASSKTVTLAKFGLVGALGAIVSLTITTLTATTANISTANVQTLSVTGAATTQTLTVTGASIMGTSGTFTFSGEAGSSTGVILCLRSTGTVGRCAGGGTGSGTRVCSTCSAL